MHNIHQSKGIHQRHGSQIGLTSAKPIYIPMLPNKLLTHKQLPFMPAQHAKMSKILYGNMIGHVLWPIMISRPDTLEFSPNLSQALDLLT